MTSSSSHACLTRRPTSDWSTASTVVIAALPTLAIGVTQERVGTPSRWTVHAPQNDIPQPNLVPLRLSSSRSTHSRGGRRCCVAPPSGVFPARSRIVESCMIWLFGDAGRGSGEVVMTLADFLMSQTGSTETLGGTGPGKGQEPAELTRRTFLTVGLAAGGGR